ncbi:hypothetical protein [Cytobacillus oceanisediminis]|uniref:hypothetical protein n=1 Tax=Cytobacillus oceanisediminis TaxID=665099 RepID=UPI000D717EC9|nr:hypothetical protein [Cytobacillus oceanisediminis]
MRFLKDLSGEILWSRILQKSLDGISQNREQAMKAPVKMVSPLILFIFPAIIIVLLGSMVIYLIER